ncbi:MAG: EamA family transporter [Candidatus Diapherotrites archaeon]|nr:EamA family transporter [Candidatus Diapherotrites archaeon]
MSWFFLASFEYAILALLGFGSTNLFVKKPLEKLGTDFTILVRYFFAFILTLAALLIFSKIQLPSSNMIPFLAANILIGTIAILALYKAMKEGKLSIVLPFSSAHVLIVLLFGIFVFHETLSITQLAGAGIGLIGALVIALQRFEFKNFEKGISPAIITLVGWGFYFSILKILSQELDPFNIIFYSETGIFICLLVYFVLTRRKLDIGFSEIPSIGIASIISTIAILAYNFSIGSIGIALTAFFYSGNSALSVILSRIFLKEQIPKIKYLAVVGIVAGLMLIALV